VSCDQFLIWGRGCRVYSPPSPPWRRDYAKVVSAQTIRTNEIHNWWSAGGHRVHKYQDIASIYLYRSERTSMWPFYTSWIIFRTNPVELFIPVNLLNCVFWFGSFFNACTTNFSFLSLVYVLDTYMSPKKTFAACLIRLCYRQDVWTIPPFY